MASRKRAASAAERRLESLREQQRAGRQPSKSMVRAAERAVAVEKKAGRS